MIIISERMNQCIWSFDYLFFLKQGFTMPPSLVFNSMTTLEFRVMGGQASTPRQVSLY